MSKNNKSRRQFLLKTIAAGALLGIGCPKMMAASKNQGTSNDNKAVSETVRFMLSNNIGIYKGLEKKLGSKKLVKMLENITNEDWAKAIKAATSDMEDKSIDSYAKMMTDIMNMPPYNAIFDYQITEQSEKVLEVKYNKCLFAEVFKEMDAANIGWALQCSSGESSVKAFNPKMTFSNSKNMMKGDEYCFERIELKS